VPRGGAAGAGAGAGAAASGAARVPRGLAAPAAAAAAASVADVRGQNTWLAHVWVSATTLIAANAAGQLVVYVAPPPPGAAAAAAGAPAGALVDVPAFSTLPAAPGVVPPFHVIELDDVVGAAAGCASCVVATALAAVGGSADAPEALAVGCSDGTVRFLALPNLELVRTLTLSRGATGAAPAGGAPVARLSAAPGGRVLFGATAAGTLHAIPLALAHADGAEVIAPLLDAHAASGSDAVVALGALRALASGGGGGGEGGPAALVPLPSGGGVFVSASARGALRAWGPRAPLFPGAPSGRELLGATSLVADAAGGAAPPRITALATHRRLPLLAVGTDGGAVALLLLAAAGPAGAESRAARFSLLHAECVLGGAVTSLAFADGVEGAGESEAAEGAAGALAPSLLLAAVSAPAAALALIDVRAGVEEAPASEAARFAAIAFARVPRGAAAEVTAALWLRGGLGGGAPSPAAPLSLFLACAGGHILSLTLPPLAALGRAAAAVARGGGAADLTASLRFRARVAGALVALVGARASPACPVPVLIGTIAGEKAIALLPVDARMPEAELPGAAEGGDEAAAAAAFAALPATAPVENALNTHRRPGHVLALSPAADSTSGLIVASGGADGAVTLLGIALEGAPAEGAEGEGAPPGAGGGAPTIRILHAVGATSYSVLHAAPVGALAFAPDGAALASATIGEGADGAAFVARLDGEALPF
jgi:hypothetical protein